MDDSIVIAVLVIHAVDDLLNCTSLVEAIMSIRVLERSDQSVEIREHTGDWYAKAKPDMHTFVQPEGTRYALGCGALLLDLWPC